jgi:hypothetical protein
LLQNGLFLLLEKAKSVFKAKLAVQQSLIDLLIKSASILFGSKTYTTQTNESDKQKI